MILNYLAAAINVYAAGDGKFEGDGWVGIESCFLGHFLFTCSYTCSRMYCSATMHTAQRYRETETDRRHDSIMPGQ